MLKYLKFILTWLAISFAPLLLEEWWLAISCWLNSPIIAIFLKNDGDIVLDIGGICRIIFFIFTAIVNAVILCFYYQNLRLFVAKFKKKSMSANKYNELVVKFSNVALRPENTILRIILFIIIFAVLVKYVLVVFIASPFPILIEVIYILILGSLPIMVNYNVSMIKRSARGPESHRDA